MAFFPMFFDIEGKEVLVVGGGDIAFRKVEKLLPFNPKITLVAEKIKNNAIKILFQEQKIKIIERKFLFSDIDGKDIVIVAVDDVNLQRDIYMYCNEKKIFVNSVDSPDYCNFIFPAYIKKGDIVIGITTSGKAPSLSGKLREIIEKSLPSNIENILDELDKIRKSHPKGKERQEILIKKLREIFE
ncbi:bifunctional precorrin-2 dehydrogenase/sirohydrochlorin ferrochelatase [Sulfurihydrogenibium sp.]|uniref:precorrin-2 dehydrogenase/sirohydrochlorin ferrochelatase family protein n=1 Tax=Sulfurihydrogenibium sp. TaxID=2053621 RepID=UPI00260962F9|nr:bifunctional precorrin-2 dehydrogenase/sirohydrochlorin ferrochelatase [Sulfurihydrogenibium sp.]